MYAIHSSATWNQRPRPFRASSFVYHNNSQLQPMSSFEYDFEKGSTTALPCRPTPAHKDDPDGDNQQHDDNHHHQHDAHYYHYDNNYVERRFVVPTYDDDIPISLTMAYRSDGGVEPSGPRRTVVSAYGAYGDFFKVDYDVHRFSLLERGLLLVHVCVRGDGDMGKEFYLRGKFERKMNSFLDLRRAMRWLVDHGWTQPGQIAVMGRSAGGLMAGTALRWWGAVAGAGAGVDHHEHPSQLPLHYQHYPSRLRKELERALNPALEENRLVKVVVARVPFVDVINDMLDGGMPWTAYEW